LFLTSELPLWEHVSIDAPLFSQCIVGLFREKMFQCPGRILLLKHPLKWLTP